MPYSLTQLGNIVVVLGTLFAWFGLEIPKESMEGFVMVSAILIGALLSWFGRFRKGDLDIMGFRK